MFAYKKDLIIYNSIYMQSNLGKQFLQAIENDIPVLKLMKFRHFITKNRDAAGNILGKMQEVALNSGLIAQYQQIYKLLNIKLEKIGRYKQIREQFIATSNKMKIQMEHFQQIDNTQQAMKLYLELAQLYSKIGDHNESDNYYKKLFKCQTGKSNIKMQAFFQKWALEIYYKQSYGDLLTFLSLDFDVNIKKNLVNLALIKDIKLIQMRKPKIFENVIGLKFNLSSIASNKVISTEDLGILYSIWALVYADRKQLSEDIRWSSNLQSYYLTCNYPKFFSVLKKIKNDAKFHPLLQSIIDQCCQVINNKIITEVLNAYSRIPIKKIVEITGILEDPIILFIKNHKSGQYLIDPVKGDIVKIQDINDIAFYKEVIKFETVIAAQFKEKVKSSLQPERQERGGMFDFGSMGGRMGGMGGMGGMGRMGGFGKHGGKKGRGMDRDSDDDQ